MSEEHAIRRIVAEVCATDASSLVGDRPLIEYGLDSARAIDLLLGLENEFALQIPDDDARRMRTLDDVVAYVRAKVASR